MEEQINRKIEFLKKIDEVILAELKARKEKNDEDAVGKKITHLPIIKDANRKRIIDNFVKKIHISFLAPKCFIELSKIDARCSIRQIKVYMDSTKNLSYKNRTTSMEFLFGMPTIRDAFHEEIEFFGKEILPCLTAKQLKELYDNKLKFSTPGSEAMNSDEQILATELKNHPLKNVKIEDEILYEKIMDIIEELDKYIAKEENISSENIIDYMGLKELKEEISNYGIETLPGNYCHKN